MSQCSKQCQTSLYPNHKKICTAIQEVENYSNTMFVNNIKTPFQSHLSPKEESKVAKLIGSKCLVNCSLNDISTEALLDSGAQVSAISESNFDIPIRPISDIVGIEVIDLEAADESEIPYLGFVELYLKLTSADISNCRETLRVQFLVTGTDQENSVIIKFDVLEEIITESDGNKDLKKILINSVPTLKSSKVGAFVNLIKTKQKQNEDLASVKICRKKDIILPKGSISQIKCKTNIGVVDSHLRVMFEPDGDISLLEELKMSESLLYVKPG